MKRKYCIHIQNYKMSNGEIDAWSNHTHDYDITIQNGIMEFNGTEEELDALLDRLYSKNSNVKCLGVQYSDEELRKNRDNDFKFVDLRK
jgi:hypothetical protein